MRKPRQSTLLLIVAGIFILSPQAIPCSMFKITLYGKTMVGNNEDAWQLNSRIWFEQGGINKFGCAYVGHANLFPQGGINEAGLSYDGFTVYPKNLKDLSGKKKVDNPGAFLKDIMQHCKSVEEVQAFAAQYDRSVFNNGMLLFIDKSGKYLVMEVDTMTIGNDEKYVLSNFCPSITPDLNAVPIGRYQRGRKFLENKADTSLTFCVATMDTMHECRKKMGDGTTYTTIYDLENGLINLYFYHDFKHVVQFNLAEELKKGDHMLTIPDLFPQNDEYATFSKFSTPFNNTKLRVLVLGTSAALVLLTLYFMVFAIRQRFIKRDLGSPSRYAGWLQVFLNLILVFYLYVLSTTQPIFYFDAPYAENGKPLINLSSYIPFILLFLFIPVLIQNKRIFERSSWSVVTRGIFSMNTAVYFGLIILFGYWKLLNLF